jgi:hypothetical protein
LVADRVFLKSCNEFYNYCEQLDKYLNKAINKELDNTAEKLDKKFLAVQSVYEAKKQKIAICRKQMLKQLKPINEV